MCRVPTPFTIAYFNIDLEPRSSFESQITENGSLSTLFSLKVLNEVKSTTSELPGHNAFKYYFI